MIATIIIISLAFIWLGYETDWLTIRLPYGKAITIATSTTIEPITQPILLIPQYCQFTLWQRELGQSKLTAKINRNYNHPIDSYQSMAIGNQTITLNANLPNIHELIAEVYKVQTDKPRKPSHSIPQPPLFITRERIGSHKQQYGMRGGRRHYEYTDDYETVYHDCLIPKDWLKHHEHDLDGYEPTIELTIDSKSISINGNYKRGVIKEFVKTNS